MTSDFFEFCEIFRKAFLQKLYFIYTLSWIWLYWTIYCTQSAIAYSKLTIETLEQGVKYVQSYQWHCSGVFIVNFDHISHLVLVFLLLTLSKQMPAGYTIQKSAGNERPEIYLQCQNRYNRIFPVSHVFSLLISLCEKCSHSELFWPAFSTIRTEYGEIRTLFTQCLLWPLCTIETHLESSQTSKMELLTKIFSAGKSLYLFS